MLTPSRIIGPKENAPEFDYSPFYRKPAPRSHRLLRLYRSELGSNPSGGRLFLADHRQRAFWRRTEPLLPLLRLTFCSLGLGTPQRKASVSSDRPSSVSRQHGLVA